MTFSQLEIFVLVAELKGFTSAASRLSITQSAVSHAIKALESELGVELINRHQSTLELTAIGEQLLLRARAILGLTETMRQEASDARGMKRGTLRIGSFGPTSSVKLLPLILDAYRKEYPGIEVHVDEGRDREVVQWLQDRRIDVGFAVLPDERFDTFALAEDQMVALVPAAHPLAAKADISLKELAPGPFIMTEAGSAQLVGNLFNAAKLIPNTRYRSTQLISTLSLVERGDGVTILAEQALPCVTGETGYVKRPLRPRVKRIIGLAVLDERQVSPAAQAFIKIALRLKRQGVLKQTESG
ncbi:DNA-binding transcriptional LysR family regulator [Pseudomonas duriflava]|uniref:DNA-binding transcriptional LysR family regulator n=1 Tax=Pseudomonas duriflava TaxID=459528 RepID=A0A562QIZ5_9PSED|nr:LysR family transcriptional regulator [Pseudomonas duriflava]TWI56711.1 DNA-binding transcriptional LysR family regulator [Pseudomonas duriflava]